MNKYFIVVPILSAIITIILGIVFIPILRKLKVGQPILKYVETHKTKSGTPTMGGLLFIIPSSIVFYIFSSDNNRIATVSLAIGLSYLLVGFLDDFIKIKYKENEGLKPYQKIIFQSSIALIAGVFLYKNNLTIAYIPFVKKTVDLDCYSIIITALIFISITNSVNLTDGLDGLASSVSVSYLLCLCLLIIIQLNSFSYLYTIKDEYYNLILLSFSVIGSIFAFLVFNSSKASIFMGDTGSLSLGGFLGAISVFSSNMFFIPIIGCMFVLSSVSVIIQVVHYKRTKKRVFLMTPFHHHLQLKGYSESKISFVYSFITCIMGLACIIFYV